MNRLKCIKAFNFGKKNRELLCLKESPNLLRGAWRIRTAVDGFADRRLKPVAKIIKKTVSSKFDNYKYIRLPTTLRHLISSTSAIAMSILRQPVTAACTASAFRNLPIFSRCQFVAFAEQRVEVAAADKSAGRHNQTY